MDSKFLELTEALEYNPDTGNFHWKINTRKTKPGQLAGCLNSLGYVQIMYKQKNYSAHRLAWLFYYGYYPAEFIDHINEIKADNRITNLRLVNNSFNMSNVTQPCKNNTCGYRGVSKNKKGFSAKLKFQNKLYYLGTFASAEQAHQEYTNKKQELTKDYLCQ
jgi:HNH endonuclease